MTSGTPISVHRCRFVDFQPAAITALAFPPLPLPRPSFKGKEKARWTRGYKFGTLVVGRANGDIELGDWTGDTRGNVKDVEAPQAWVVRKVLSGPYGSKVDSLALALRYPERANPEDVPTCADLRLFSSGGGSELVEWDMERGSIRQTTSSQGGSIWSMAVNPSSTTLALGCEDGVVRLLSLELDALSHVRRFDRVKTRILSLAWGAPRPSVQSTKPAQNDDDDSEDDDEEWVDEWLVTGGSDSSLRKWDVKTGRVVERMGTDKVRGERTLVWTVATLGNGTIISGDSMGHVKFWDSHTCTQMQSFAAHGADVLCLTISSDGSSVYTSGVDQKITEFSLLKPTSSPARWVQSTSRRLHTHDVRALVLWPPYAPLPASHLPAYPLDVAPVLASGGLDMSVVLTPAAPARATSKMKVMNPLATSVVAAFEDAYQRRIAYLPRSVVLAREGRLVVSAGEGVVGVWRIALRKGEGEEEEEGEEGGWKKVLELELAVATNITACAVSPDGRWLAVSDWYETKLFALQHINGSIKPKRVREMGGILAAHLPSTSKAAEPSTGASALVFTPDSSRLILATAESAYVVVVDLHGDKPTVLRRFEQHRLATTALRIVKKAKPSVEESEMDVDEPEGGGDETEQEEEPVSEKEGDVICEVSRMCASGDGQWLATTDDRCRTHIFNLDSIQYHAVVPTMPLPVKALAFLPASSALVLALADNSLHVYDVEARQFPAWARELSTSLPKRFTCLHDAVVGVAIPPVASTPSASPAERTLLLWGSTWICKVRLDVPAGHGGFAKKRRRGRDAKKEGKEQENFKLITHYRPILLVDFIGPGEMVVVERPLVDVLAGLPPAYFRPKYGRS